MRLVEPLALKCHAPVFWRAVNQEPSATFWVVGLTTVERFFTVYRCHTAMSPPPISLSPLQPVCSTAVCLPAGLWGCVLQHPDLLNHWQPVPSGSGQRSSHGALQVLPSTYITQPSPTDIVELQLSSGEIFLRVTKGLLAICKLFSKISLRA